MNSIQQHLDIARALVDAIKLTGEYELAGVAADQLLHDIGNPEFAETAAQWAEDADRATAKTNWLRPEAGADAAALVAYVQDELTNL